MSASTTGGIGTAIDALRAVWLAEGATGFSLAETGDGSNGRSPIHAATPSDLIAPLIASGVHGELRVVGPVAGRSQRLAVDAALLAGRLAAERELQQLTAELVTRQDQLMAVIDLARTTRRQLSVDPLLQTVVAEARDLTDANAAFAVFEGDLTLCIGEPPIATTLSPGLRALASRVENRGRPVVLSGGDIGLADWGALSAVPIPAGTGIRGMLGVANRGNAPFNAGATKLLETVGAIAGSLIETAVAHEQELARQRLQREMELAGSVQSTLIPRVFPAAPGIDLAARFRPAASVGGDFYDFVALDGGRIAVSVADVTGKGMPAALLMTMARTALRGAVRSGGDAAAVMRRMADDLYDDFSGLGKMITVFLGVLDPERRELDLANCGHSPVIHCPSGATGYLLEADDPPIGVLSELFPARKTIPLGPGDLLVIASDGFSEAEDESGAFFGYERLIAEVEHVRHRRAEEIADALFSAVTRFAGSIPQSDDQTLVVMKGQPE